MRNNYVFAIEFYRIKTSKAIQFNASGIKKTQCTPLCYVHINEVGADVATVATTSDVTYM